MPHTHSHILFHTHTHSSAHSYTPLGCVWQFISALARLKERNYLFSSLESHNPFSHATPQAHTPTCTPTNACKPAASLRLVPAASSSFLLPAPDSSCCLLLSPACLLLALAASSLPAPSSCLLSASSSLPLASSYLLLLPFHALQSRKCSNF